MIYGDAHVRYEQSITVSVRLGDKACHQKKAGSHRERTTGEAGLRLSTLARPRSRRSAKWGLEDNTAWYGKKERSYGSK